MSMQRDWDAIVVGAGPAGSAAAITLARAGASTLLIDKAAFPRWKVCGCCLSPAAVSSLHVLGLSGLPSIPIESFDLATPRSRAIIPLRGTRVLSRELLDARFAEAAVGAGAEFLTGMTALSTRDLGSVRSLIVRSRDTDDATELRALVVLLCDGLAGAIAPELGSSIVVHAARIGLGATLPASAAGDCCPRGTILMTVCRHGYLGAVRLEDGRLNLAAALSPRYLRAHGSPGEALSAILQGAGRPAPDLLLETRFRGTPALTRRHHRVAAPRLLALGDSAAYAEPFTGEGIAWALEAGHAAGAIAHEILTGGANHHHWQGWFDAHLRPRHRRCELLARVLRLGPLTDAAVGAIGRIPPLAAAASGFFARPLTA